jgi:hypothetical protein
MTVFEKSVTLMCSFLTNLCVKIKSCHCQNTLRNVSESSCNFYGHAKRKALFREKTSLTFLWKSFEVGFSNKYYLYTTRGHHRIMIPRLNTRYLNRLISPGTRIFFLILVHLQALRVFGFLLNCSMVLFNLIVFYLLSVYFANSVFSALSYNIFRPQ